MSDLGASWQKLMARTDYERCARPRAARFSLDSIRGLTDLLGRPQDGAVVFHLAGSKGKGSVCHFLEKGLRAAGFHTGLYTSPHLCDWRERVRVDGAPAADACLARSLETVLRASRGDETFFDLLTAAAFLAFREQGCDAWVVEVGLGGRFDSTNVVQAASAAVISIEREHVDVFGDDLKVIAAEKAGIYKAGSRLWSALAPEHVARGVLWEKAREVGEPLLELPVGASGRSDLPHPQPHMQRNFALARAMLADYGFRAPRYAAAAAALDALPAEQLRIAGRWDVRLAPDGRTVVLDVAHTPASLAAALESFRRVYPRARRGVVIGLRDDKDAGALAAALGPPPPGESWWTAPAGDHPRSADPERLARVFEAQPLASPAFPGGPEVLLITGSTYLVGALLPDTRSASTTPAAARSTA